MEAKAGPSGHLWPEAAGLSAQEHSATARRGPAMEEHSDLDEQRPQRAWTKVSGARTLVRGMINCWAAGLPSREAEINNCTRPIGIAGEDLPWPHRRPVHITGKSCSQPIPRPFLDFWLNLDI